MSSLSDARGERIPHIDENLGPRIDFSMQPVSKIPYKCFCDGLRTFGSNGISRYVEFSLGRVGIARGRNEGLSE
jgi:hypothetical protein